MAHYMFASMGTWVQMLRNRVKMSVPVTPQRSGVGGCEQIECKSLLVNPLKQQASDS